MVTSLDSGSGEWGVVSGEWSVASGQWEVVSGKWSRLFGNRTLIGADESYVNIRVVAGSLASNQYRRANDARQ